MATNSEESFIGSSSSKAEYEALKTKGRALARGGRLEEAEDYFIKAYRIFPTKKLKSHIRKIQDLIKDHGQSSIDMIEVCGKFHMPADMYNNLYPYQREAVKWMWKLFEMKKGGVLGDDMGLGKTIQIIAFLSAMMEEEHINTALLIMPVSLIENWKREFNKWAPEIIVKEYHSASKKDREKSLLKIQISGGVLLTTYGIVTQNVKILTAKDDRHFVWDYVVLDEGHKIKNPTKTTKAVHEIYARHRLVLTGTPIQNNLRELWALYDYVHQGTLLGSLQTFKMQYDTPITKSREKDATAADKILGSRIAENLRTRIAPYFLRRTKQEVLESEVATDGKAEDSSAFSRLKRDMSRIRKNEFIVWVFLSPVQIKIYTDFLESDRVKNILVSKRSPLVELTVLKKISDHPRLLSHRACVQLGLEGSMSEEEMAATLDDDAISYFDIKHTPDDVLVAESGKMGVLIKLLENLRSEGHRTLVFSMSCRILDIIQKVLVNRGWTVLRLDGKIKKTTDREKLVNKFQNNPSYPVFLLTTQVGGVGLTLTAADRVVIYDPSWNPATDSQAVDRAYRIGQTKSVVIYRLISCGSVEEKIYRRQIFKDSITQQTTGKSKDPHRYFTSQELRELFILDDPKLSTTQLQLETLHSGQRKTDAILDRHITFLHTLDLFGISDHDLMFKGIVEDESNKENVSDAFIAEKVKKAEMLMSLESNLTQDTLNKAGSYAKPFDIPLRSWKSSGTQLVVDKDPNTEYENPVIDLVHAKDESVEDISFGIRSLDVTGVKIKSEFASPSSTRSEPFCAIISSDDDHEVDEKPPVIAKKPVQPIVISDEEYFEDHVSSNNSHQKSVTESEENDLPPEDQSTMEIFPSDAVNTDKNQSMAVQHQQSQNPGQMDDIPTSYDEFCRNSFEIREKNVHENSLLENEEKHVPQEIHYDAAKLREDEFEDSTQNESVKMSVTPQKFQALCLPDSAGSCSTTPEASDSDEEIFPQNDHPELLSRTTTKFPKLPVHFGKSDSCTTTPEISDSDDDEKLTECVQTSTCTGIMRKEIPLVQTSSTNITCTRKEIPPKEHEISGASNRTSAQTKRYMYAASSSYLERQKRLSPELSDSSDDDFIRSPFEEAKKLRIRSPLKSDSPQSNPMLAQQRRDLSKSLVVKHSSPVVKVDPFSSLKGKGYQLQKTMDQPLQRTLSRPNDQPLRRTLSRPIDQPLRTSSTSFHCEDSQRSSVDEFRSATSSIFEDSDIWKDIPSCSRNSLPSKSSTEKKAKRRSLVMVIETSDEESEAEEEQHSREELIEDSLNSQAACGETTDEEAEVSDGDSSWQEPSGGRSYSDQLNETVDYSTP